MESVSGDIGIMAMSDLVAWMAHRKMTCTLNVKRGGTDTNFVIREGLVWQAGSSDPREYLGQHLINFGYIDEEQLQKAFDTQKQTKVPLGRVLVMVDAVTPEELARVLLFKTRESFLEAMCWSEGQFRVVREIPEDTDLDCDVPIDLREVHSEGIARMQMWQEIRKVFPTDATRCDVVQDTSQLVASQFDRRLLDVLKAGRSIGEAALELRSMDFQIYARLYDLYNRSIITPRIITQTHAAPEDESIEVVVGEALIVEEQAVSPGPASAAEAAVGFEIFNTPLPIQPAEQPGVEVPEEANDPAGALKLALAGRNWSDALLIAERILEMDPGNADAHAARRIARAQVQRMQKKPDPQAALDVEKTPNIVVPRGQLAKEHLTSKERYVLSRIDGRRTLSQIAAVSPIQKQELLRIVQAFVARGTVSLE